MEGIYKSVQGRRLIENRYREFLDRWPTPNQQMHVTTRFGQTFVICGGTHSSLPPLVLLHGSGSNSAMWIGDAAVWARDRKIYAIDMIGQPGLSEATRPLLNSDGNANWLDDVLAALHIDRFAAIGVSLGGWLILDYATRTPARIDRLCLLAPGGIGRQRLSFLFKVLPLLLLGDWGLKKALRLAIGDPGNSGPHEIYMDFMALVQKSFRPRRDTLPIFSDTLLQRLTMPILTVIGGKDAILDSADTRRRLSTMLPHAQVLYLPNVGHGILGERAAISQFLRGDAAV